MWKLVLANIEELLNMSFQVINRRLSIIEGTLKSLLLLNKVFSELFSSSLASLIITYMLLF